MLRAMIEKFGGGPVGLDTLAATTGEDAATIEDVYEPYLLQLGFLMRTPRGRVCTQAAYDHMGIRMPKPAANPNQVKMDLAIRAIIKAEGLEVSDEEVETEMKNVADKYGMDLDTVKKYLRTEDVKEQVMREKVIKVVADSAKAVAPEAKEEETKAEEEGKND